MAWGARGRGIYYFETWTTQIYIFAEIEKKFSTKPFMASYEDGIGKHYLEMSFWNFITLPAEERGWDKEGAANGIGNI